MTGFPVKQGGLAAQQADVAARAIAVRAGSRLRIEAYRPVLRAELITGGGPEFCARHRAGGEATSAHSREPLWWPPEKIAARYLGPLLAAESAGIEFDELIDLDPPDDPRRAPTPRRARAISLLLAAADADARAGEYAKRALAQLALAERLDLVLPPEYVARRDRWRRQLDPERAPSAGGRKDRPHPDRRPWRRSATSSTGSGSLREHERHRGATMKPRSIPSGRGNRATSAPSRAETGLVRDEKAAAGGRERAWSRPVSRLGTGAGGGCRGTRSSTRAARRVAEARSRSAGSSSSRRQRGAERRQVLGVVEQHAALAVDDLVLDPAARRSRRPAAPSTSPRRRSARSPRRGSSGRRRRSGAGSR